MSANGDDEPRLREVAYRLFAAEFDEADFSYSESDEERAPNYVVTPTGARVNRLFAVGVLTEIESVNQEVLRARVADSTGAFVVYAGQYQPEALAFLESAEPPTFVAVTGKARTFEPEDSDRVYTSIRPESISEVDAETRDRWVVQAAEQTVERIGLLASAKATGLAGDELRAALEENGYTEAQAAGITLALDHYGTTGDYLQALRETALDSARVVTGERDEARGVSMRPGDGTDDPIPLLADVDVSVPETADESSSEPAAPQAATAESGESVAASESSATQPDSEPAEATASESAASAGSELNGAQPSDETTTETATADESAVEPDTPEPDTETDEAAEHTTEPTPDPASGTVTESAGAGTEAPEADADSVATDAAPTSTESEPESGSEDDDLGDFEPEFELDDDEREEIESEFGTEFQSGADVDDPGEADIETPDPETVERAAAERASTESGDSAGTADAASPDTTAADATDSSEPEPAPSTGDGDEGSEAATEPAGDAEPTADLNLEDAVMDAMKELNDGAGADREELVATVVDRHGADPEAVSDAIQDALMGGRCYEPEDGKLTPI
jgi:RPA family protein